MKKKVFVSGCFDLTHSGHIAFLKSASEFGDLYVSIGSDKTIKELKNYPPIYDEKERKYILSELKCVHKVLVGSGTGVFDFVNELEKVNPDIFIVNFDGDSTEKKDFCESRGIKYKVLERIPAENFTRRSTTDLRFNSSIPYRIDLAGGWLDQPFVSKYCAGPVLTISIEPTHEFNFRSGMATSTRNKAIELWKGHLLKSDEKHAQILFAYENPPGTKEVTGSQDSLGIVLSCLNKLQYCGGYWPSQIETIRDDSILSNLESLIRLIPLSKREEHYNVLKNTEINKENAKRLSLASENCFNAILSKDKELIGRYMKESFEAQVKMFPDMITSQIKEKIKEYGDSVYGYKLSGAGGGGYLILITDNEIENSLKIKIRREEISRI